MEFIRRLPDEQTEALKVLKALPSEFGLNARPIYYLTYPEFLSRKKAMIDADNDTRREMYNEMEGFHGRSKDDALNVRLLILDDLGKEYKGAGYNDASFDEILRSRYDKGLPTIITTNVERDKWAGQYGSAMGSFVFEAFRQVVLTGKDLRKG
jgi:DNA replication protein DnaC